MSASGAPHKTGIRRKVTLMITLSTLFIVGICIILSYVFGLSLLRQMVGNDYTTQASILAGYIGGTIKERVENLNVHLGTMFWQEEVIKANKQYANMKPETIQRYMVEMDKKWVKASTKDPLGRKYLNTVLSIRLKDLAKLDTTVAEIFLTDKYGGLVAASNKTSDFYQADEDWWQETYAGGQGDVYIGKIELDQSSRTISIPFAVPLRDKTGKVIGICKAVLNARKFFQPVAEFKIGKSGHASLLDYQGFLIFHEGLKDAGTRLYSRETFQHLSTGTKRWAVVNEPGFHKEKMFEAFAEVPTMYAGLRKLNWFLFIGQPAAEVFTPLYDFIFLMIMVAIIGIILLIPLGYILGGIFTKPIHELHIATERVIQGDWSYPIQTKTGDEIEQFADTFKEMIETVKNKERQIIHANREIKQFSIELEAKVEERTGELSKSQAATLSIMEDLEEAQERLKKSNVELEGAKKELEKYSRNLEEKVKERAAELSVLYELSNAIAYTMDYNQLMKLIMEALFDVVNYDVCGVLLFDATSAGITLTPSYPQSEKFLDEVKDNLIKDTSALTGENIVRKNINFSVTPSISPHLRRREEKPFDSIKSSFNVPFVVKGKTVGIINVSSCRENVFDEDDRRFIHTIANQASSAIERLQSVLGTEKSKMGTMVESMQEGVIMIDHTGGIAILNPQARRMLNFGMDKDITTEALEKKLGVDFEEIYKECRDKKYYQAKDIIIPQEQSRVLRCEVSPVLSPEGPVVGLVVVLRDITKEKELERMKSEFISTISHELRTPLTTIRETVSQILDGILGETTAEQRDFLNMCMEDTDRLKRIIDNLLDISKIEAKRVELKREMFNMVAVIRGVIASFLPVANTKGLELKEGFSKGKIEVYADKDEIIQIFTNLIGNALKFTEKGYVKISVTDKKDSVECSVADTGYGIAKGDLPRIFDKFQQFGRVAGPGEKGTGLGLSITKSLVELHKGTIRVESELNKGTIFTFNLPKYKTPKELCRECLSDKLNKALDLEAPLSVLLFEASNFKALVRKLGEEKTVSIINNLATLTDETLRRKADQCLRDVDSIVVMLPETSKEEAARVEERIRKVLENYLTGKKVADTVALVSRIAAFPEDGDTVTKLLNKIGLILPGQDEAGQKTGKK